MISSQYQRENQLLAVWKRLRTNPGAVVGLIILCALILIMVYSVLFISYEEITVINSKNRFAPPSAEYPFGTDEMGRDLMKRIFYGSRYSLAVAFGSVFIGMVVGIFFGSIAGFFGGWVDNLIMRIADIMSSIPGTLLGMVIVTILGANLINLLIAVGVASIAGFIRMARASVLTVKSNEYVESARAIGMSELRIIFTQVVPNSLSPLIVTATARMATSVLSAAGLSFLGFGITAPKPEWGALISGSRAFLNYAPHLCYFPGLFIMLMAFACALLGDGLRDALDPKLKK
ncbi:MAG: ABC transporter permease [Clostridiales bacterium]|nr:ABC transporter permease [Clostridiales bacterium]